LECSIDGTGAWKSLTVVDTKSGELVVEKKFYKADFSEVWNSIEYSKYVDVVFNAAFKDLMGNSEAANLDTESFEEVRQVAMDIIDDDFVNPE